MVFIMLLLPAGKVLIIGGGIANFTNVAATFKVGVAVGGETCFQDIVSFLRGL